MSQEERNKPYRHPVVLEGMWRPNLPSLNDVIARDDAIASIRTRRNRAHELTPAEWNLLSYLLNWVNKKPRDPRKWKPR